MFDRQNFFFKSYTGTRMDARRTKRQRDEGEELSLDEHIERRRSAFVQARREAPELKKRAEALREQADGMTRRWQMRRRMDMLQQADELEGEARTRLSMVREHEFEQVVVTYLRTYHKSAEPRLSSSAKKSDSIQAYVRHTDRTAQCRAALMDEYLREMNEAPPKVAMAARDECPRCGVKLLLCPHKSVMTCSDCGYSMAYLDATSLSTSFDEVVEYSQYSYKRTTHFSMWIALSQGKEAHRVPDDILRRVMQELHAKRIRNPEGITLKRVREVLRRLKLRKAYDHVVQITARLSGVPPQRVTANTEEKLRMMFLRMQPAFERHAPKNRTNFLSYPYVLYRCFQILKLDHMLDCLSLLKGREKLELNDAIFKKMCVDLGWPTFDLPPVM